jgi:hypothetical protein
MSLFSPACRLVAMASFAVASSAANAALVSITFDTPIAGYTPTGLQQALTTQFDSLGLRIVDVGNGNVAPSTGDCTGGVGSDPFHLYGAIGQGDFFGGCGDTTPNLDFLFFSPGNPAQAGYTTSFSILITDGGDTVLTAYGLNGSLLATVNSVSSSNETLSVSGVGPISRVNVRTPFDSTAYDDLAFESVQTVGTNVPVPSTLALIGLAVLGLAGTARRTTRR